VGPVPVAGLLHRNQTLARLADTIRSVYGRPRPPRPGLTVVDQASFVNTGARQIEPTRPSRSEDGGSPGPSRRLGGLERAVQTPARVNVTCVTPLGEGVASTS
jgi:hypothetical protein